MESGKTLLKENVCDMEQLYHSIYSLFTADMQAKKIHIEKLIETLAAFYE